MDLIMRYKQEFPNYDDVINVPEGFEDFSWHNDACPSIGISLDLDTHIIIWCEYKSIEKRESGSMHRFIVCITNDLDNDDKGYFDDLDDAVLFANALAEKLKGVSA